MQARAGIVAFAIAFLCAAALPSGAAAGVVSCPANPTYTMAAGDPPLALQANCTGVGAITYSLVTNPAHGSLVGTPSGDATYTPNVGFAGTDAFTYRATDSEGGFTDRTITIVVQGSGTNGLPPSCPDPVRLFIPFGQTVTLTGNCADPDGDPITYGLVSMPASGLNIISATQVTYSPADPDRTSESFLYSATDPHGNAVVAEVQITVIPPGTTDVSTAPVATATTPLVAGVETGAPAPVTIGPRPVSSPPPAGYFFLGTEFRVEAPAQTAADPLRLTFTVDHTAIPLSGDVIAFRDANQIDQPCDGSGDANPDPCLEESGLIDPNDPQSDYRLVVLTSHASRWNLGYAADADADGHPDSSDNCPSTANPAQRDVDGDGIGTACDPAEMPATKDACKGGWEDFHDHGARFRNQGDCASWVATRGKNAPAR